jgi:hypothetical protein
MKTIHIISTAVLPALLACGCSSLSNTENGALAGGAIGAGTGALIGHATGHTAGGALIGAGVGALSGGLIGNAVDKSEAKTKAAIAAQAPAQGPLGLTDIVQMAQQHVSDDVIITQIRTTRSVFNLSGQDTIWLKNNGVSDPVLQEMLTTRDRYPGYYAGQPVYVVEPPPPPVAVGVGFGYGRRW